MQDIKEDAKKLGQTLRGTSEATEQKVCGGQASVPCCAGCWLHSQQQRLAVSGGATEHFGHCIIIITDAG